MDEKVHRELAVRLFNETWDLIEKEDRTRDEDSQMLEKAHASLYHWRQCGTPLNIARGAWQISRVHALLGQGDSSLFQAIQSLQICEENKYGDFDLAFAHEAMARAYAVLGNKELSREAIAKAEKASEAIQKEGDRTYFVSELASIHLKDL
jgi:hypothetical protein